MSGRAARLEVRGPDGRPRQPAALESNRVSVGRITPVSRPDISLEPDPHQWVGRFHCLLEAEAGAWWVTDNATVNGTYVRSGRGEPNASRAGTGCRTATSSSSWATSTRMGPGTGSWRSATPLPPGRR